MKERKQKTPAIVITMAFVMLAVYFSGYVVLRVNHDFVRDATYYTGSNDQLVPTDWVRLGEWRGIEPMYRVLAVIYWPARWLEAMCWRVHRSPKYWPVHWGGADDRY